MPVPMIRSYADMALLLGCDPREAGMSRRVDKDTACGGWLAWLTEDDWGPAVETEFLLHVVPTFRGYRLRRARLATSHVWYDVEQLPARFPTFWQSMLDSDIEPTDMGWCFARATTRTLRDTFPKRNRYYHFSLRIPRRERTGHGPIRKEGIAVGSIVEGSDATTSTYRLYFPFPEAAYWQAVQNMEDEAAEIWNREHEGDDV